MRHALLLLLIAAPLAAQKTKAPAPAAPATDSTGKLTTATLAGLRLRNIGPALTSGRVTDIAVHPSDKSTWYVAAGSAGVWKTVNGGTTWTPVFEDQGAYSIGVLAIDPKDPLTVWVGTGENNSQRSVGYGDGVYKSMDGGANWENMGLKASGNIGRIAIDPKNSNVVWVAAQGPLWSGGGDRGLYKTTDGGKTWELVLKGENDWTGANEVWLDPRNPDVVYATTWQRFRRQWGFINGGPGSAIQKSVDGGKTWKKLAGGLPSEEMGKIGLAIAPKDPNTVYAVIEAANKAGGLFRSTDAGSSWRKMSGYGASSPMYYDELIPDPNEVNRIYSIDVNLMVTIDSGRTFSAVPGRYKHVDHHALWIDPDDTRHMITGNDGGLYDTHDRGATWRFAANLPITQFYKLALDNDRPFYNVYGGTQDNNTIGCPSRTRTDHGVTNQDCFIVVGGDGFTPAVDPEDANIVYGEWQHGELNRFDRKTGELTDIQPQSAPGEPALRWNWDSPLIISPHARTRLYFAAQRLFRTDDRGDTWRPVSPDLTRQLDRNALRMMGRVWSVDAVAKNTSTSFFGNIVSLAESPKQEGLIYAGTDDGLVQVTEDGGTSWRKTETFAGVPDTTYVSDLVASQHGENIVYATFNNQKAGDFRPYVLRSADKGRTWASIAGDLPVRGSAWTIAEDPEQPNLLFVGTEFGIYLTVDGGTHWVRLKGGLPTIPVRDIAIQKREGDLVLATFGRGFYVLDDYSPLRSLRPELLTSEAALLPVRAAPMFLPASPLGGRNKASQGDAFFTAPNPAVGATFTWYLKEALKSRKDRRREAEKAAIKKGQDVTYPTWDDLRAEDREEDPIIQLLVSDEAGNLVRRLSGPASAGMQRVTWDLRYPSPDPITGAPRRREDDDDDGSNGPLAAPGTYRVQLARRVDGVVTPLGESQAFMAAPMIAPTLPAQDKAAVLAFQQQAARLQRAVMGSAQAVTETQARLGLLKRALDETPKADPALRQEAVALEDRLRDLQNELAGDRTVESRSEPTPPSITDRVQNMVYGSWQTMSGPTNTHRRDYQVAADAFGVWLPKLRQVVEVDLKHLHERAEAAGAPWTPGRVPEWKPER